MVRTFVAVELPAEVRAELSRVQSELRNLARERDLPVGRSLKWVEPEGIHLTLKFLGEVGEDKVAQLVEATRASVGTRPPLALQMAGSGAFPSARQPRVLWVGLAGDLSALAELQRAVDEQIAPLGFPPESRPFSPHLTLARVREQAPLPERRAVAELLSLAKPSAPLAFNATRVSLMKSKLRPTGARYEALATYLLGG